MTTTTTRSGATFGVVPAVAVALGALVFGYGLLLVPVSLLGGVHVAAIGLSVWLAGLFATTWAATRWNLSTARQRRLAVGFALLALLLAATFVVVNYAGFVPATQSSSGSTG